MGEMTTKIMHNILFFAKEAFLGAHLLFKPFYVVFGHIGRSFLCRVQSLRCNNQLKFQEHKTDFSSVK